MPFEKGHQLNVGRPTSKHLQMAKSLALWIRDGVDPGELRDRLLTMARGRDPATGEACTVLDQQRAMQMLFDRGWGQAAQHVVIEGEIRTELVGTTMQIVKPTMTLEEITKRRADLLALGVQRKVIDAESTVKPQLPESDDEPDE